MKRPVLLVVLAYAGGVLAADRLSLQPFACLAAAGTVGVAAWFARAARPWWIATLLFLTGVANHTLRTTSIAAHDLRRCVSQDAVIATVQGRLVETPYHKIYQHGDESVARTLAQIDVESIRLAGDGSRPAHGRVIVSTPGLLAAEFHGGKMVELEGVLKVPDVPVAPGQFDYRAYLRRHGIHFQLQVAAPRDWRPVPGAVQPSRPPLSDRFIGWAQTMLARGLPEDESIRLLWAMTLGWKSALTGEVAEPFMRSGTMHVFAISGLHIALIAGIWVVVLQAVRVPSRAIAWIVIPLIWFYTYATGWQASAVRSTVMMSVILAGKAVRRPSDLLNSLATAGFIILLWDTQQLFQAGFQLSFSVVLSLALSGPLWDRVRDWNWRAPPGRTPNWAQRMLDNIPLLRALPPDPWLAEHLQPRWRRWMRKPFVGLRDSVLTSLAAWLGSIPLVAFYFNLFTPISLVANLIVVPLSSAALAANMASLSLGVLVPGLADVFNHAAWFFMIAMARVSQWTANWPGAWTYVSTPGPAFIAWYYAALLVWMTGCWKRPKWRKWCIAGLGILGLSWGIQSWRAHSAWRLTILPLHGGDAVSLDAPGTQGDMLVDCGNENAAQFVIKPFLRSQGINHLSTLVLTHGDIRHVGGAEFIQNQFSVTSLATSPVSARSAAYRQARDTASPGSRHTCQRGDQLGLWTVLHPAAEDRFPHADDNALVLSGSIQGTRVLLLSDLGKPGQSLLLERNGTLPADIVVAGLPAQGEPLAEALLDAMAASVIIVTDSLYPATARAGRRLRERLAQRSIPVFFTSDTGALILVFTPNRWTLKSADGRVLGVSK